jgi:hypothetical protein
VGRAPQESEKGTRVSLIDQETITWHRVEEQLPEVDLRVLVCAPEFEERVQFGWYDGVYWFSDDGDFEAGDVIAWADAPKGIA